jgi:alpha-aminoadipic semialdehyde synthase
MKFVIIRETKNDWERRAPLTPDHVRELVEQGLDVGVVASPIRAFEDEAYSAAGATVERDTTSGHVVLGIKEPPVDTIGDGQVFMVFSHTIKGQAYNMPLLQRFLDRGATLIDYERIVDDQGRRLIAFGNYAGIAGAIDSVWALRGRLDALGIAHPLGDARMAHEYATTTRAYAAMREIDERIRSEGFDPSMGPVVFAIVGCGNVGRGAGEVLDHLGAVRVSAADLGDLDPDPRVLYRVDLLEHDLYERLDGGPFELQEYYDHPERYRCVADALLDHVTLLINTAYWDVRYPRVVPRQSLRRFADSRDRMLVIGDVSCDVGGSVEATVRCTDLDAPVFVYDPDSGAALSGVAGRGTVVLSVDHLPCELSEEASMFFGDILRRLLPGLAAADLDADLDAACLPPELLRAAITWRGALTPAYEYLQQYLDETAR